ncbi:MULTISPECIES: hypothetical protein [unclassified Campylobacter]|uniref:hypothetical protein n=1 Tax=unclassified Campylobacter TaxID=2593542 RepID=UPI001BDA6B7F|nr:MULTISPECIES: hypothetical protein [unclassified Campylobacter]MBZ7975301.1 hypothetical protein [Campylobacter sp. RM12637]MBZ7978370.1 hypothetical protein [Campylobacter sp. RM12654]MBZ7979034.1 hypothetical protein [Campylobacter sp. RM12642]MBZ7981652.1 hypothetical protein [Campylobacter sp. RM12640]MBZ7984374.1 hypothetical protein [Campylobacter sp. RM12647]MBZ7988531.1 hypothetical protein [Campylobacter sp. RM12635]MBZ7990201.1 hypothetical protein [Campylobacter sp. RM9331]MBZ
MKKVLCILVCIQAIFAMTRTELDNKFNELVQVRNTIDYLEITKTNDPFYKDKIKSDEVITFTLYAIVDKRVKINQKWYGLNEIITAGYRVVSINNERVGLSNSINYVELNLKDNQNVQISVK